MAKHKKPKIPLRVKRLVMACEAGATVKLGFRHSEIGDERFCWIEPGGRPVGWKTVAKALDMGVLEPAGDGLFGESQTFRLAERAE